MALRKQPGAPAGWFAATGELPPPGNREVRGLSLTRAIGDLGGLADYGDLRALDVLDPGPCTVPAPLALPASLTSLSLIADDPEADKETVRALLEAVDWERLGGLEALSLGVGGVFDLGTIAVDLGFLGALPNLTRLDVPGGIRHSGPGPSPLEPPFDGLSKRLEELRVDAADPAARKAELQRFLGVPEDPEAELPAVVQRVEPGPPAEPWAIVAADGGWTMYGTLRQGEETEYEAAEAAETRLREADAELAARLEFDPENAGTGITAADRESLEAARRILGV